MSENELDFWAAYDAEVAEGTGGGGVICRAEVSLVWKTFPAGVDQEQTVFYAPPCYGKSSEAVKATNEVIRLKAVEFGQAHGAARPPSKGPLIRAYRDSAVSRGRPAEWEKDRFFFAQDWTDAGKLMAQSIREAGIKSLWPKPWVGWVRLGFQDDPFKIAQGEAGKTSQTKDGTPRFPQVAVIAEVFASEEAARAAIGVTDENESGGADDAPPGWGVEAWKSVWPELYEAKQHGATNLQIAGDYSVPIQYVVAALNSYVPV